MQRFEPHYSSNTRTKPAVTPRQNASTMMRNDPSQGPLSRPPHQRRSVCAVPDWIGRPAGARALEGKRGAAVRVWSLTDRPHHAIGAPKSRCFRCVPSPPALSPLHFPRAPKSLQPLELRKATLARLLSRSTEGIQINEHLEHDDGGLVFEHACRLGLEGIVSKHKRSPYRSGSTEHWVKMKNPAAPAVTRVLEEDWRR